MKRDNNSKIWYKYNGLTPTDGSLAFIIAFVGSLIFSFALSTSIKDQNALSIVFSVINQLFFIATAYYVSRKAFKRDCPDIKRGTFNSVCYSLGFNKRTKASLLVLCVLMPIFSILAFLPISALVEYLFKLMGYNQTPTYADYTSSVGMFLACVVVLCILPAFGEEMVMRGALARGLRAKGTIFAIVVSSLMFAFLHGSPVQFIHQFLIGLIMAYITILTDCIWHSVIFHFVNNFAVILYEFIYKQSGATYVLPTWSYGVMFVVGLLGLGGLLVLFTIICVKTAREKQNAQNKPQETDRKESIVKTLFDTSEYKYKSYEKTPCATLYVALALVILIWIANTVVGWIQ